MADVYSKIAGEYYDRNRHPTSANLRSASLLAMRGLLHGSFLGRVCELGAGRSVFLDLHDEFSRVEDLVLVDASSRMLSYSAELTSARNITADAAKVDLPPSYFDCIVASLGDAMNLQAIWALAAAALADGGRLIYTGPSLEWARKFRDSLQNGRQDEADFDGESGVVRVPSYVRSKEDQFQMWSSVGLSPLRWIEIYPGDVPRPHSSKILDRDQPLCVGALSEKVRRPHQ